jgi:hypothetical protein
MGPEWNAELAGITNLARPLVDSGRSPRISTVAKAFPTSTRQAIGTTDSSTPSPRSASAPAARHIDKDEAPGG